MQKHLLALSLLLVVACRSRVAAEGADSCWDLDRDGECGANEDVNGDSACDPLDCQGPPGADGPTGAAGDAGADGKDGSPGADGPAGPDGADGLPGADGLACWDADEDGSCDPIEDVNTDGVCDVLDCQGPAGADGPAGPVGPAGADGLSCWDLDGSGICEPSEDVDGVPGCDARDCTGPQGAKGDTGSQGAKGDTGLQGAKGDTGLQGFQGIQGLQGIQGIQGLAGQKGLACWDVDGDANCDSVEDIDASGTCDAYDCQRFPSWGQSSSKALPMCDDILATDATAGDGTYWIDPDSGGPMRPFQAWCDMSGGGWTRVDELSHYDYAIHTEGVGSQTYIYGLTDAQINAIKLLSTEARQSYECQTVGVGAAYNVVPWTGAAVAYAACWDPGNTLYRTSAGTETTLARVPFRRWESGDCGDVTEACEHNVGHAYFR